MCGAGGGDACQRGGHDRRDGQFRPDRHETIGAEGRESEEPDAKANNPLIGGMPTSRAVAS